MGVQLALLLAVPLIGLGIGSPQADHWFNKPDEMGGYNGIQADHYLNGGLPSSGAGYSWNFPGGMNRGYQQGQSWQRMGGLGNRMGRMNRGYQQEQSWQRMGGLGNRMGSPRYADYSRAGQYRYGGIGLSDLVCLLIGKQSHVKFIQISCLQIRLKKLKVKCTLSGT